MIFVHCFVVGVLECIVSHLSCLELLITNYTFGFLVIAEGPTETYSCVHSSQSDRWIAISSNHIPFFSLCIYWVSCRKKYLLICCLQLLTWLYFTQRSIMMINYCLCKYFEVEYIYYCSMKVTYGSCKNYFVFLQCLVILFKFSWI